MLHLTRELEHAEIATDVGWRLSHSYAELSKEFFTAVHPTPVREPSLVIINTSVAEALGLSANALSHREQIQILAGNRPPPGGYPIAQAYAGHQFGGFTMLGDGRAILLGEQTTSGGQRFDVQLKGSGPTPYSRRGDGRASLGPMLREYIISHAMQALGIPTTLSLAVVRTGEPVYRYGVEPGAVLTRIAASHLRVGTFQYAAVLRSSQKQNGNNSDQDSRLSIHPTGVDARIDPLNELADYAIRRHYPELLGDPDVYGQFLRAVIRRQADLVARWMCVGFIHGVMNTDNVSIAGETIDYGPCAFMNAYSPSTVFSSIDEQGRYAYGNQPGICQWNLARFAETLLPLLNPDADQALETARQAIGEFPSLFSDYWLAGMGRKIGLKDAQEEDRSRMDQLLSWMDKSQMDFTTTFRDLTFQRFEKAEYQSDEFLHWKNGWLERLKSSGIPWDDAQVLMRKSNPVVIPRNHRVEEALTAAVQANDLAPLLQLLGALSQPFDERPENEWYRHPPEGGGQGYCTYCGT